MEDVIGRNVANVMHTAIAAAAPQPAEQPSQSGTLVVLY